MGRKKTAKEPIILTYTGKKKIATLNQLISKWAWANAKQYYRREFITAMEKKDNVKFKTFALEVTYNTKHDPDNLVAVSKFFIDTCRELGYMEDDTRLFYRSLNISYDPTLPKVTVQFKLIP